MTAKVTVTDEQQLDRVLTELGMADRSTRAALQPHYTPKTFQKGDVLLQPGQVADQIYFICSGLIRFYYLTPDGKEHNKSFAKENQFAGAIQLSSHPDASRYTIECLEPTHVLAIPVAALNALYQQSLPWANVGRLYMESVAVRKSDREASFLLDSAEVRYKRFVAEEPDLVQRLPLYHIASFLGITDVALSRIRRQLKA